MAFVGYRDYSDPGRLVHHDFVPIHRAEEVMALLQAQQAGGGDDLEEDVLSGAMGCLGLNWSSHLRMVIHVADAPAHGYGQGGGDNYPSGLCPDQLPPHLNLPQALSRLAEVHGVDYLFCRIQSGTGKMEKMISDTYNGDGFGTLSMNRGADVFKEAILSTVSNSLLKLISPEDISGLVTFTGDTVSSLMNTSCSSLRESITNASRLLKEKHVIQSIELSTDSIELVIPDEVMGEEKEFEDHDEVIIEPLVISSEDISYRNKEEKDIGSTHKRSRNDYERLLSELDREDLYPVKMALGIPLDFSLQEKSVRSLLDAGVSVPDLVQMNYPREIIDVVISAGVKMLTAL